MDWCMKTGESDSISADTFSVISTCSPFSDELADFYQNNGNAVTTPVSLEKCCMIFMDSENSSHDEQDPTIIHPREAIPREFPSVFIDSPIIQLPTETNNNCSRQPSLISLPSAVKVEGDTIIDREREAIGAFENNVVSKVGDYEDGLSSRVQDASVNTLDNSFWMEEDDVKNEKNVEVVSSGKRLCIYILGFDLSIKEELDQAASEIKKALEDKFGFANEPNRQNTESDHIQMENASNPLNDQEIQDDPYECPVPVTIDEKKIALPHDHVTVNSVPITKAKKREDTPRPLPKDKPQYVSPNRSRRAMNMDEETVSSLWNKIAKEIQYDSESYNENVRKNDEINVSNGTKLELPNSKSPYGFLQKVISARINSVINNPSNRENSSRYVDKDSSYEAVPKLSNSLFYKLCLNSARKCNNEKDNSKHISDRKHGTRIEATNYFKRKPLPNIPSPTREFPSKNNGLNMYRKSSSKTDHHHHVSRSMRHSEMMNRSLDNFRCGNPKYESFSYGRPTTSHDNVSLPQKLISSRCKMSRSSNGVFLRAASSIEAVDAERRWRP